MNKLYAYKNLKSNSINSINSIKFKFQIFFSLAIV